MEQIIRKSEEIFEIPVTQDIVAGISFCELRLRLYPSGCSMLITDPTTLTVYNAGFLQWENPDQWIRELNAFEEEFAFLFRELRQVYYFWDSPHVHVPHAFFDESKKNMIYLLEQPEHKSWPILFEKEKKYVRIWANPPKPSKWRPFSPGSLLSLWKNQLLRKKSACIQLDAGCARLWFPELPYYNVFAFSDLKDVVYYYLYVCEQLDISAENYPLLISGQHAPTFKEEMRKFVEQVSFLKLDSDWKYAETVTGQKVKEFTVAYDLMLAVCE